VIHAALLLFLFEFLWPAIANCNAINPCDEFCSMFCESKLSVAAGSVSLYHLHKTSIRQPLCPSVRILLFEIVLAAMTLIPKRFVGVLLQRQ